MVKPKVDDELQEVVLEVLNVSSASPAQLRCAALASLNSDYYVVFPAPLYQAYETLYWPMSRERDKQDARAWLEERGLLSRLPTYDPKVSNDSAFAQTLEALCGPKAAGTLQPVHGGATFRDGALGTFTNGDFVQGRLDDETMRCLLNSAEASGYPLGIIGNEAIQKRP